MRKKLKKKLNLNAKKIKKKLNSNYIKQKD